MKQFPNHARVCFVGDSITHRGLFMKHVLAYYREQFPELKVEFYNCGIAGGNLGNTIGVFEEDISIYDPTHIVLMIGVNDSRRTRLEDPKGEERYGKLLTAYENYKKNMESFYQLTQERGIELILCTPMPYAEDQDTDEFPPLPGGYALMQGYAEFVRNFAREKGLTLCDYHAEVSTYMQTETLYAPDRVHPTSRGQALMAKVFLKTLGMDYDETNETFSKEIEEWYNATQTLRNIITTEFLLVPNYLDLKDDERMKKVGELHENIKNGTYDPGQFFANLIEAYVVEKPRQAEHIDFVKNFMKQ